MLQLFQNTEYKPDYTKTVKISTTALSAKRFFKRYCHIRYVVSIPQWSKYSVSKPENIIETKQHSAQQHWFTLKGANYKKNLKIILRCDNNLR